MPGKRRVYGAPFKAKVARAAGLFTDRWEFLDPLGVRNRMTSGPLHDSETAARIDRFKMAFRTKAFVPELADLSTEPANVFERYGSESRKPGSCASNCILALSYA